MHPILARGTRLALYLAVWTIIGLLLAALLAGPGGLAASPALPLAPPIAPCLALLFAAARVACRPWRTCGLASARHRAADRACLRVLLSLCLVRCAQHTDRSNRL